MNRIYKSVWNAVTRSWTAVSEWQKSHKKSSACIFSCFFLSTLLLTPSISSATRYYSSGLGSDTITLNNFFIGNSDWKLEQGLDEDETWINYLEGGSGIRLNFDNIQGADVDDVGGTVGLLNLATEGYRQVIFTTGELHDVGNADNMFDLSGQSQITTSLSQNNAQVANLTFAIGNEVYQLFKNNQGLLGSYEIRKDRIYFDIFPSLGFTDDGVAWAKDDPIKDNIFGIYLLTLLTDIQLTNPNDGQGLSLTSNNEDLLVTPVISGAGNIIYSGRGSFDISKLLTYNSDGSVFTNQQARNTYTGNTSVLGSSPSNRLSLNLTKEGSLGNTKFLKAQNANINVKNSTEVVKGNAEFYNSGLVLKSGYSSHQFSIQGNADFDEKSSITSGDDGKLTVLGRLSIKSDNSSTLAGSVTAGSAYLTNVNALGNASLYIDSDSSSEITTDDGSVQISLAGGNNPQTFNNNILKVSDQDNIHVKVTNSVDDSATRLDLTYGDGAQIQADDTNIGDNVTLHVKGIDQLGSTVTLSGEKDGSNAMLEIQKSGNDSTWSIDSLTLKSENSEDIVEVNGAGFSIQNKNVLSQYKGWLRLSNTEFQIFGTTTTNFADAGLSLGANSTFFIRGQQTVHMDRLGWTSDIESGESGGVLDLTLFDFDNNANKPALSVGYLDLNGRGEVHLDFSDITQTYNPQKDIPLLDADDGAQRVYQIISATQTNGSGANIQTPNVESAETDVSLVGGSQTPIGTAKWGYGLSSVTSDVDPDGAGLWLSYTLLTINLENQNVTDTDDYLTFNLSKSSNDTLSAQLTGNGHVFVTRDTGDQGNSVFTIQNGNNDFNGTLLVDSGIKTVASVGSLGQKGSDVEIQLKDGSGLTITDAQGDESPENRTQYLSGLTMEGSQNHALTIGQNSILALQLSDIETTWDNVKLSGNGTLRVAQNTLTINGASSAAGTDFSGRIAIDESARLNLRDDVSDQYTFKYLSGSGTVGVGLNAIVGSAVTFTGDYDIEADKELTINANSASVSESGFTLNDNAKLKYIGIDGSNNAFGNSLNLNGNATVLFDGSTGQYTTVTTGQNVLSVEANNGSDVVFDLTKGGSSIAQYDMSVDKTSSLTYKLDVDNVDVSKAEGEGQLWLDFANPISDLQLTGPTNFTGTLGYRNATLNVGYSNSYSLGNDIHFTLGVGSGSTLITHGQTKLAGLLLEEGSTLDFTSDTDSYVPSGLSVNGIKMEGNEITVNGPVGTTVNFDLANVEISLDENVTPDSFLDALSSQSSVAINIIEGIKLKDGQTVEDLAGNFNLSDKDPQKVLTITQNGEDVAEISTSVGIIGQYDESTKLASLGVGGVVSQLKLLKNLDLDVSQTTQDVPRIAAQITGEGSIKYISGAQGDDVDVVVSNSSNNYTGSTIITDDVHVRGVNSNTMGLNSSLLQVGTAEIENNLKSRAGTLTLESTSGNLEQRVKQFVIEDEGKVNLTGTNGSVHIHIATDSQDQHSVIKGKLSGTENSAIWTQGSAVLDITENADLSEYKGTLVGTDSSVIRYQFSKDQDWNWDTQFVGDSVLAFDGSGVVNILNDSDGALSVRAQSGTVNFSKANTKLNRLETTSKGNVQINGLLTVNDFVGSDGILEMDVALGSSAGESVALAADGNDGLLVKGTASGTVGVLLKDKNKLEKGKEERLTLIQVDGDASDFSAHLVDSNGMALPAITAGGYDYVLLAQDQNVQTTKRDVATGTDYVLSSVVGDEEIRNTTVTAGSYIGIAYAAQLFDVSLHDRVGNRDWINPVTGEKQSTSLWMRHSMSHERFRDSTSQLRMRSTSNVTMLGGDLVQYTTEGDGFAYAGLMGGYGTMDTKSRSKMTNLRSKSETDAWGIGAYAGWKANKDGQTGPYVDGWLMFTHASSDVTGVDRQEENIKGEGLSASIEAGWGFKLGSVETTNGKYATFTLEPHASVTWFGMEYDDLHTDAQDVKFEGKNNVRTRLGTRVNMTEEGNKTFNAFAEANWVHNTQEYGATISGLTVDQTGSRNQAEGRIGVDWRITKDLSAWARVGASFGSDNYSEREGSIGVRYQF